MPGLKDMTFVLGHSKTWTTTIKKDGSVLNLSGYKMYLRLNDVSVGGTDFQVNSTDDTDWIAITTAASGLVTLIVDISPSNVPATGAVYRVAAYAVTGATQHRFGGGTNTTGLDEDPPVTWTFKIGGEGAFTA